MSRVVIIDPLDGMFEDGATENPSIMVEVYFSDLTYGSNFIHNGKEYYKYEYDIGISLDNIAVRFDADELILVQQ